MVAVFIVSILHYGYISQGTRHIHPHPLSTPPPMASRWGLLLTCRLRLQQPFQRLQLYALASVVRLKATERTPLADSLVVHTVRPPKAHFGSPDDDLAATVLVGRPWFPYGSLMGFLRLLWACNQFTSGYVSEPGLYARVI